MWISCQHFKIGKIYIKLQASVSFWNVGKSDNLGSPCHCQWQHLPGAKVGRPPLGGVCAVLSQSPDSLLFFDTKAKCQLPGMITYIFIVELKRKVKYFLIPVFIQCRKTKDSKKALCFKKNKRTCSFEKIHSVIPSSLHSHPSPYTHLSLWSMIYMD